MKVLCLSMTVGRGHNSASNAIKAYLEQEGHICDMLDTYKFLNRAIGEAFDKGYTFMGRFWPRLNENIYSQAEKYNGRSDMKMYFPWLFADINKTKLQKHIEETKPDIIVCSIVMTAIMITLLKESNMIDKNIKSIGIVTDYSLHPFWEYTDMDYFVCPNELMIPSVCQRGIPESKILPIGIPIEAKYSKTKLSQADAQEKLGLQQGKFTIMMSAGGMGFSGLLEAAQELDGLHDVQIVAICGTNKQVYAKLNNLEFKNHVHILQFVTNMHEYMDASDVFITKPGGLSTSEAIAKQKPILLTKPMPGVENMNHAFLLNNSLAVHANKYQPLQEVIMQLRMNDQKRNEMKAAQARWGKPDSTASLARFMQTLLVGSQ